MYSFKKLEPLEVYEAESIGSGACGNISIVYDNDGKKYVMKTFEEEEDETLSIDSLRELSMLRILEGGNAHPNIVQMKTIVNSEDGPKVVMPQYCCDLKSAIQGNALKGKKLQIAHGIISAVSHLHEQHIMHRDLKTENIMFDENMNPILIDFGMAKYAHDKNMDEKTHSGDCGTAGYMAPEVYRCKAYDCSADLWSLGVILLELFHGELNCDRDKAAFQKIKKIKNELADKPVNKIIRSLLNENPDERMKAKQLLELDIFKRFKSNKDKIQQPKIETVKELKKSEKKIPRKMCNTLEIDNPNVLRVAEIYFLNTFYKHLLYEYFHGRKDKEKLNSYWLYCILAATKLYENEQIDLEDDDNLLLLTEGKFDVDDYIENEKKILEGMNYCMMIPNI
jgi:serine/threonine protein kinase